jgi:hypothetical protein
MPKPTVLALLLVLAPPGAAAERAELLSARKIWDQAPHNAFTRLVRFRGQWFCTFRESDRHVPGRDGTIRVLRSADGDAWESAALLAEPKVDLRDPKLMVMSDGRLMLLMGGSVYDGADGAAQRKLVTARPRVAFSRDGREWTDSRPILSDGQWLWDMAWHAGHGYGFSYSVRGPGEKPKLTLVTTADGLAYETVCDADIPDEPNEAAVAFRPDGTLLALVRRERGDKHAWFGHAKPPYTQWEWKDSGHIAQGPALLVAGDGRVFYAGRDFPDKDKTVFGEVTDGRCTPLVTLPSGGGDTGYPGLVQAPDGVIWMSYYARHEGKAAIYLARIRVAGRAAAPPAGDPPPTEGTTYDVLVQASRWLYMIVGLGGPVLCAWAGWSGGRRGGAVWPRVVLAAAVWGAALAGTGLFLAFGPDAIAPAPPSTESGTTTAYLVAVLLAAGAAAVPAGFAFGMVAASLARGPTARQEARPQGES